MYRDTEQSYGSFTFDVYETKGAWIVDWHWRNDSHVCGQVRDRKRKEAIRLARLKCDEVDHPNPNEKEN